MEPSINQILKTQIIQRLKVKSANESSNKVKMKLTMNLNENAWVTS